MYKYTTILYILSACMLTCIFSCRDARDFLDPKSTNELNEAAVFIDSARTMDFLSGIYSRLEFGNNAGKEVNTVGAGFSECTDEAETRWPGAHNVPNQIFGGTFGPNFYAKTDNSWSYLYTGIRHVNIYLKNLPNMPLSPQLKARTALEARFLRAYFYHNLIKYWGGVVLVGDEVFALDAPNEAGRNTYAECVDYIVSELDAIALPLPLNYNGINYGRITRGAALALKSRVLLFAASPLFNGGSFATDPEVISLTAYPSADESRWGKALQAAQDVMEMNRYSLHTDNTTRPGNGFYQLFLERVNNEYILAEMVGANKIIEAACNPPSRNGNFLRYPSQQLVDAFPMKNGKVISEPGSGYNENDMYANRDPRFYFTVVYNGALYFDHRTNAASPVYTYQGANLDGLKPASNNTGTNTGYYVRKAADENLSAASSANTLRCPPILRYAEIMLNLAEAAVETGDWPRARMQLVELRKRAGIEPGADGFYGLPANPGPEEARELVHNERFIELAFEEHRYWDLRRWRIGDRYDGKFIEGIRITSNSDGSFSQTRFNVRSPRYFKANSYLFPIPQTEIAVNRNIKQNPGW
ncbi:RagB/SusD family nutrient uptake outer membrane protein [Chitinophaga sp. XS-30]|uniref:RagB/SusD family nutrient uptake outer membrane protein n=1 Tax=Chitinophaga sp. XS-30 TaxID=2604421 RepID=UPI00143D36CC|nr:RagB/SusD family nutrient uptake outer membrane protein [Chitinophaga sp. XS-30]